MLLIFFMGVFSAFSFMRQWKCVYDLIYNVICCRLYDIHFFFFLRSLHRVWFLCDVSMCMLAVGIKNMKLLEFFYLKFVSSFAWLNHHMCSKCIRMKNLISGSVCGCINIQNIELMPCSSQAPIPHLHMHRAQNLFHFFFYACVFSLFVSLFALANATTYYYEW